MNTQKESRIVRYLAPRLARQMAGLVAISVVLGLAFNAVNPIGIKYSAGASSGTLPSRKAPPAARISRSINGVFQNEVLSLTLNEARPGRKPATTSLQAITWEETKALISSGAAVLVDARPASAFAAGHIPGAVSLPFMSTEAELGDFRRLHDPRTPLIVYCANAACPIADHMARKLISDAGYQSVRIFAGGFGEWQRTEGIQTAGALLQARMQP